VLLYALSSDSAEQRKAQAAISVLNDPTLRCSTQVLQEFYVQVTRPTGPFALSHEEAVAFVAPFLARPVQSMTVGIFRAATATCRRFRISYWDAAIIEAARALGCDVVLTEDLHDGQDYDGVRVENPFA
jgi:predicted nucleic acid-binding protein